MQHNLPAIAEAFRRHYEDDTSHWGNQSGPGSDPFFTIEYRCFVDKFIRMNKIKTIVDIGCGDWQFSRFLNLEGVNYIGFDVVPSVIEMNRKTFTRDNVRFEMMPAAMEEIPQGDLLLMKDVLQHLPNGTIAEFKEIIFPKFKHCLLTNSFIKLNTGQNMDIEPGGFRCLDLAASPYGFSGSYVLEFSSPVWERIRTFLIQS